MSTSPSHSEAADQSLQVQVEDSSEQNVTVNIPSSPRLQNDYTQLQNKYRALEEEMKSVENERDTALQSKESIENDCRQLYQRWNEQLQEQSTQFSKMKGQIIPTADLELLRVQLLEELETPYREKINWYQSELAKSQQLYSKVYNDLELTKLQISGNDTKYLRIISEQKKEFERKLRELNSENINLQSAIDNDTTADECRKLHKHNSKLSSIIVTLKSDIETYKKRCSETRIEMEKLTTEHLQQIKTMEGRLWVKSKECESAQKRTDDLLVELALHKELHMSTEHKFQKLESDQLQLSSTLNAKDNQITALKEKIANREKEWKEISNNESQKNKEELQQIQQQLHKTQTGKESLLHKIDTLKQQHSFTITQLNNSHSSALEQSHKDKQEFEKKLQESQSKLLTASERSTMELDQLRKEMEMQQSKIRTLAYERANLEEKIRTFQMQNKKTMDECNTLKQQNIDITNELQSTQTVHRSMAKENQNYTTEKTKLKAQIEYLEKDLDCVSKELENTREMDLKNLQMTQHQFENDFSEMRAENEELVVTIQQMGSADKNAIEKMKKDKNRYKKLATVAKQRLNGLTKEVNLIKREHKNEMQLLQSKISELTRQLYEMERQRDEIKFRMTVDSFGGVPNNALSSSNNFGSVDAITNNVDSLLKQLQMESEKLDASEMVSHSEQ